MNRTLLEKPFEPEQIRRRQGRNGMLDYVEGHSVIQRLNDALDGAWSFEVTHHELRDDEVIVLGKLTAETITKMAFGTSQVTREKNKIHINSGAGSTDLTGSQCSPNTIHWTYDTYALAHGTGSALVAVELAKTDRETVSPGTLVCASMGSSVTGALTYQTKVWLALSVPSVTVTVTA